MSPAGTATLQWTRLAGPAGAEADGEGEGAAELEGVAGTVGAALGLCEADVEGPEPQAVRIRTAAADARRERTA
ncbi:MAG TPA: hypothetical protein VNF26_12340 [Candidatus Baltobacterales bacterium]|nr:hypothetical protein [Candidatus Baltobacterales bacterium]